MLYFLNLLADDGLPSLALFKSVAFRAALAAVFSFLTSVILGPYFIAYLRRKKVSEDVRKKDSQFLIEKHAGKSNTPTMGGVILIGSTIVAMLLFARPDVIFIAIALFAMLSLGLIGFYDDWVKLTKKGSKGLGIRDKLLLQAIVGGTIGLMLCFWGPSSNATTLVVPFLGSAWAFQMGYLYMAWSAIVVTGSSNAVNLTDGLDGLATLCAISVALAFGLMAYFAGHAGMAEHLGVVRVAGGEELAVVCAALAGSCMGFLWFNAHPADIFMGDTGSLPLGGLVGVVALSIKQELMLVLIGGIFVMEALSVLIQIASFRWFGRRVFKIAPLHHHFEKVGWSETKIVTRFFIISALLAVFGVAMLRVA